MHLCTFFRHENFEFLRGFHFFPLKYSYPFEIKQSVPSFLFLSLLFLQISGLAIRFQANRTGGLDGHLVPRFRSLDPNQPLINEWMDNGSASASIVLILHQNLLTTHTLTGQIPTRKSVEVMNHREIAVEPRGADVEGEEGDKDRGGRGLAQMGMTTSPSGFRSWHMEAGRARGVGVDHLRQWTKTQNPYPSVTPSREEGGVWI